MSKRVHRAEDVKNKGLLRMRPSRIWRTRVATDWLYLAEGGKRKAKLIEKGIGGVLCGEIGDMEGGLKQIKTILFKYDFLLEYSG